MKTIVIFLFVCVCCTPSESQQIFTDERDGQQYETVRIGSVTWMAENLNYEVPGSCCYQYQARNCEQYGRLYTWEAAMKACPEGWKLPDDEDWDGLLRINGGPDQAGNELKVGGGCGLNIVQGGSLRNGKFLDIGALGHHWSSVTDINEDAAWRRCIDNFSNQVTRTSYSKTFSLSVRCVRD